MLWATFFEWDKEGFKNVDSTSFRFAETYGLSKGAGDAARACVQRAYKEKRLELLASS